MYIIKDEVKIDAGKHVLPTFLKLGVILNE